jgi:zinc/manganese transport system substrate-binding protein
MADAVGLAEATPPGYARSVRTGSTPAAGDVAEFAASVRNGTVDVVVQVGDDLPDELRDAADDADVPVVAVTEAPDGDTPFVEWQLAQVGALAEALAEDR